MKTPIKELMLPAPVGGGLKIDGYWVWDGSVIQGEDNKYHMFAARWKKEHGGMHPNWLLHSEIIRAKSDTPEGPFQFEEVVIPARGAQFWNGRSVFNSTIRRINGMFVLFYTGTTHPFCNNDPEASAVTCARANKRIGIATSKSVYGPWDIKEAPALQTRPDCFDSFLTTNAAPCVMDNGNIFMMYKARAYIEKPYNKPLNGNMTFGMAYAESLDSGFKHMSDKPIFDSSVEFEDPFIWHDKDGFNMIAKDMSGNACGEMYGGVHALSQDGINWEFEKDVAFYSRYVLWDDGQVRHMGNMERPFILFHKDKPTHIYFSTSDGSFEGGFTDANDTWNMVIPLK